MSYKHIRLTVFSSVLTSFSNVVLPLSADSGAPCGLSLLCWPRQVHFCALHLPVHHASRGASACQCPIQDGLDWAVWQIGYVWNPWLKQSSPHPHNNQLDWYSSTHSYYILNPLHIQLTPLSLSASVQPLTLTSTLKSWTWLTF